MTWKTINTHGWTFVDDGMPNEGEYVLAITGERDPIGITRFIDGEWDTGIICRRPVYTKTERFYTSASVVYWMPLPKLPERIEVREAIV